MGQRRNGEAERARKQLAKNNRKRQTDAEKILWKFLRRHTLAGHKFRRQHVIGDYIVDFVCIEKRLVIELDGWHHGDPACVERDEQRSAALRKLGFRVVRFWNSEVFFKRESVINTLLALLSGDEAWGSQL